MNSGVNLKNSVSIMKTESNSDLFKWEKITFTDLKPETDIFLYRQMCEMLIPQKNCTNRFRIRATGEVTDFYIGSDDLLSLRFMKSFFSRLYPLKFESQAEKMEEARVFSLYRIRGCRDDGPIMVPSLLQNIAFIHNVAENDVFLDVALYHNGSGKVGVSLRVGFVDETPVNVKILKNIQSNIRMFSKKSGMKISRMGRHGSHHIRRGIDPRFLANFVRIPLDEDV